ncbi:hypothetical protein ACFL0O_06890 [Thermodesulfobacteriota bacterium]
MRLKHRHLFYDIAMIGLCFILIACGTTSAQKEASRGAGVGALVGGLVGAVSGTAVAGAVVVGAAGAGTGYAVGKKEDQQLARLEAEQERTEPAGKQITDDPKTVYQPPNRKSFVGSTWRIVDIVSDGTVPEFHSKVITFETNSKLTTLTVSRDGETTTRVESYQIKNDVLVIYSQTSDKDYIINAKYSIQGKQMTLVVDNTRIVLEEIEEKI